jgi:hypothetical protein
MFVFKLYFNCLHDLKTCEQTRDLFQDIDIDRLLLNFVEIFNCNLKFWQSYLYPKVVAVYKKPDGLLINPCSLKVAFSQFKTVFAPYDAFCVGHNDATEYLRQKMADNEYFRAFISV